MMHCYHCTNNCTSHRADCFDKDECKGWFYDTGMQHDPAANAAETAYLESLAAKYKKQEG